MVHMSSLFYTTYTTCLGKFSEISEIIGSFSQSIIPQILPKEEFAFFCLELSNI